MSQRKSIITDEELIAQYITGSEACLRTLINRHKDRMFSSILVLVRDRYLAEDIFQETFIKIIHSLKAGHYREEGKFIPWAMRIARNLIVDHHRRSKKLPTVTDSEGNDLLSRISIAEDSIETDMITEQSHGQIRLLIEHLPAEQREVLVMRHYSEMSFKEIADATGVSINTALGRMRYALINLRKLIAKHNIAL